MESLTKFRKGFLCFWVLMLTSGVSFGQTWEEIFKQRKTQLKYSLEQIVALKAYAEVAKKGYGIVSSGLNTVKDITKGEFNLHSVFINGLKTINSIIRKDARIGETIALQLEIKKAFSKDSQGTYSASNQSYIAEVKEWIFKECNADLNELLTVITSGKLEMSDDERLKRIDKIYRSTKDKAEFTQYFQSQVGLLNRQREIEQSSNTQTIKYYEKE